MCSSIIKIYINYLNQNELLWSAEFSFFITLKKNANITNTKLLGFSIIININILKIGRKNKFYYIDHFEIQKTPNLELI
jgi:hypothetical protein